MDTPTDSANGGLLPSGGIERGVTYFIVGLGITLFFLLAVFGMGRVEKFSADATRELQPGEAAATSEIVGTDRPAP
ncbi:MAG: hypothetical protein SH850_27405 [Planctomycetaceae bacterium]|nr:hypothetical protein [Planctomycetaceae bacterium]